MYGFILIYSDGSTYTITNTAHTPKVDNPPTLDEGEDFNTGEFVFIQEVTLTRDGNWSQTLNNLPATDGQGHVYEYYIKEKSVSGTNAHLYTLLNYSDPDGKALTEENNNTSLTNAKVGGNDGIIIMPSTGGNGTKQIYIFGGVIMLLGTAGLFSLKRRRMSHN